MKHRLMQGMLRLMALLLAGTLLQVTCTGADNAYITLPRLAAEGVATSIDFCYIFDCDGGFLGGAIQPCGDPTTGADDIFVDCPGGTTDTTTE